MLEVLHTANHPQLKSALNLVFAARGLEPWPNNLIPVDEQARLAPLAQDQWKLLYSKEYSGTQRRTSTAGCEKSGVGAERLCRHLQFRVGRLSVGNKSVVPQPECTLMIFKLTLVMGEAVGGDE